MTGNDPLPAIGAKRGRAVSSAHFDRCHATNISTIAMMAMAIIVPLAVSMDMTGLAERILGCNNACSSLSRHVRDWPEFI